MSSRRNSSRPVAVVLKLLVAVVIIGVIISTVNNKSRPAPSPAPVSTVPMPQAPSVNPLEQVLAPRADVAPVEGVGVAVLVDVSGSMGSNVPDADGAPTTKIAIARRSILNLLRKVDAFAREHADKRVMLGVYEFSSIPNAPPCRTVLPVQSVDLAAAEAAVARMQPNGGTPIGDAIIKAKHDLDATGLTHLHILVVTDGENNRGYAPGDVVDVLSRQDEAHRASVYFIAFDVAAEKFRSVRDAGGLVFAAADETQLAQTLDYVLTGRILAEQPAVPGGPNP